MAERDSFSLPAAPNQTPGLPENFQLIVFDGFAGLNTKPTRPAIEDQQLAWCDNFMPLGRNNLRTLYDIGDALFVAAITGTTWNPNDKSAIELSGGDLIADAVPNSP